MTINIDAVITKLGDQMCRQFIKAHSGRVLMGIDESHKIKGPNSSRSKKCKSIGGDCAHRIILTGTPQSKSLVDQWSQFNFLDERIIGQRYLTTFRNKYCVMGGYEGRKIVRHKNLDDFQQRIAPYTYRITKEEALDLPEKIYERWVFELTDENRKHYQSLKDNYVTMLDDGQVATVDNAAVLVMRLQQLTCGMLVGEESSKVVGDERLEALRQCVDAKEDEKIVIWAHFTEDINAIKREFGDQCVTYYGKNSPDENTKSKDLFMDPDSGVRFLAANPAAGGEGLNLQGQVETVIYYSNSFKALDRWQSEDRTHRQGTKRPVVYIDLVCRKSVDTNILRNLREKRSLADLTLGGIRDLISEEA